VLPRLLVHDGYDDSQLATVESPIGPIRINRAVLEADRLILINSVEPHFFAGFTGGRKSIIPGVSGFDTVQRSHAGAVTREAAVLAVDDNPVRQYIHAGSHFLADNSIWSIQTVLDKHDNLAFAFAGNIDKTFDAACVEARKCYVVEIDSPFDIVIGAIHPPLDMSLYQAMKGWELPMAGVRDGGVLIMTAPCPEGVGARFYMRLIQEFPDRNTWSGLETRPYTLGLHKLVRTARALRRFRLFAVTDMPGEEVRQYGYVPFSSLDDALDEAIAYVGTPARVLIVEDSALTTIVRKHEPMRAELARLKTEAERFDV
jgi:nickel-dependent lactate racemase